MTYFDSIDGNLVADPTLRYLDDGTAVCNFRIIHNRRRRNRDGEWGDGPALGLNVACWRKLAEHVCELRKGDRVIVACADDLVPEVYEGRAYLRVTATDVAVSNRFAATTSARQPKPAPVDDPQQTPDDGVWGAAPAGDPWTAEHDESLVAAG
jgi:single-strand DNA-binding protein